MMTRRPQLAADEVGLAFARFGETVLRSQARPVFRRRGGWLRPEAARIRTAAFDAGRPLPWQRFRAELSSDEASRIEAACRQMDLRNHAHVADRPVDLLVGRLHDSSQLAQEGAGAAPPNPFGDIGAVVMPLSANPSRGAPELAERAKEIRAVGMRLCLLDFSTRPAIDELLETIRPDIVRIDAAWFLRLASEARLRRLLGQMIERLHRGGVEVLVEGADDSARLAVALDAGADLLAGDALAGYAPVGCDFDIEPVEIARVLAQKGNVIPVGFLRHNGRGG